MYFYKWHFITLIIEYRFVSVGTLSNHGFIIKFSVEYLDLYPGLTAASWSMNSLMTGSNDIITEAGVTLGSLSTEVISHPSYQNQTVNYFLVTSSKSDIYFQTVDQTLSYVENNITFL